ncbi:MAG: class I SAM-dependent rRNA methyltransferase [Myxococcota bacterium]
MAASKAPALRLLRPLERTLRGGHPWIYREALEAHDHPPGTEVRVLSRKNELLGRGLTESGAIAVRLFTTRDEALGRDFFTRRFAAAFDLRRLVVPERTSAYRLCHGEGDRLPGISADHYGAEAGSFAVLRIDGEGAQAVATQLIDPFVEQLSVFFGEAPKGVLLRIGRSGHAPELVYGEPPPDRVTVEEHGMKLVGDLWRGQKTGLFLDHRESRRLVRSLADGRRILNLYGYTGGFSVAAGLGNASAVTTVDVAPAAIELAEASWRANALSNSHRAVCSDVRTFLTDDDGVYDLIVSDPPSFAPNERSVPAALDAYERLHADCLRRLVPGGLFIAASCSSHVRGLTFDRTVLDGARRAGRVLQLLQRSGAPVDHPRLLAFPEGDYLDVVVARALD